MIKRIPAPARRVLTATALLALAACNPAGKTTDTAKPTPKPPVATVNGQPVSSEAYALWVQSQANKKPEELTAEVKKQTLEAIENLYVSAQEAQKQNLGAQPEVAAQLELQRLNVLANALFQQYIKDKKPTEQDLKAEYERRVAAAPKLEYRARHILVKDEQVAKDAIAKLDKGAKFEQLAKQLSTDPGSKDKGGDLDWFAPGRMVKPFSDAVERLHKGEYTKVPVKSDFGYHVIRLDDTRPLVPPPYDTVKDRLGPDVQNRMVRDYIDSLRKTAKVEEKTGT